MGPLTEDQLATILQTVEAERARGELLQQQQEMIGNYLDATRSVRGEIEAILSGTGKLSNLPQIIRNLQGKVLAEKLFGPMFRELDKWVQNDSGMKDAAAVFVDSTKQAGKGAFELAAAFRAAGGKIEAAARGAAGSGRSAFDEAFSDLPAPGVDDSGSYAPGLTVTATLPTKPGSLFDVSIEEYTRKLSTGIATEITEALNGAFGTQFFSKLTGSLGGAMQGYLVSGSPFGAALGALKEIPGLPKGIADKLGGAFKGMATGAQVAGLAGAFGIKLSNTGAQIGGAIGGALPIPGGALLGSLAGGLLGGLFTKSKRGAVSIGRVNGEGAVTGTAGNDQERIAGATSLGTGINAALQQFAERLGGSLGDYAVAIGQGKENFRVSASGSAANAGARRPNKSDLVYDGKDEAAAIAAAISNAIADGAITGLSTAVQKAVNANSKNLDRALAEALKVQELEELLGGVTGTIEKAFASFERQAKERLRIATAYGFDVVKIEELNAKERLKLSKQLLEDQVGSLQRLIDEITGGSLFEGSAVDRRSALLEQIAKARADTDAGTEGAADRLASLLEQLNAVSKEVYGTTGGFAADRGAILDQARDAIARANQRIAEAAQSKSDPALQQTNAALDENNEQNAKLIAIAERTNELLAGASFAAIDGGGSRLIELARTSER